MDAVRFGRALGVGARQAAKTLVTAADAATAKNPSSSSGDSTPPAASVPASVKSVRVEPVVADTPNRASEQTRPGKAAKAAAQAVVRGRETEKALARGGKRFGQAAWEPVARLSGVLWLEVSGAFFGLFALFALSAVWRMRSDWYGGLAGKERLLGATAMAVLFGYFCVSNFVRARRRERRR